MSTPLVHVMRGGQVEAIHAGSIAVVDAFGRLVAFGGDPAHQTWLRSSTKPFQILPFLSEGGADEFDLTGEEIALICASHGGETRHVATAAAILRKGEFDETDLQCGAHPPLDERAASELKLSAAEPSPLHNNCSGKHAGMLLYCEMLDVSTEDYLDPGHPIQIDILNTLADFTKLDPEEIPIGVDGCGVPTFYLSLYRTALAWARIAATALGMDDPASVPDLAPHARLVLDSMASHPYYVAGGWSMTTPLIESFDGEVIGKEGAEGVYGMVVLPTLGGAGRRAELFSNGPLGVAIKIADGSMGRARDPVIIETLLQLGVESATKERLTRFARPIVRNVVGRDVGSIDPVFRLEFL